MKKILLFLLFVTLSYSEEEFSGKVVGISDGDTAKILLDRKPTKVRLFGIDAPEKDQAFGKKAKQKLSELIFGKIVKVIIKDKDQYGRIVGIIFFNEMNINEEMIRTGNAWVYRKFNKSKSSLELEEAAKKGKIGLWAEENPIPPWKFRKEKL